MIDNDLLNSFDNCIDMLATGESIESCLTVYPSYTAIHQPLLELAMRTRETLGTSDELQRAKRRVLARTMAQFTANTVYPPRASTMPIRPASMRPSFKMAFRVAAVLILLLTSTVLIAQNSLPGDLLYSTKRLTEQITLTITGNDTAIQTAIDERRRIETQEVVRQGREVDLVFTGEIEQIQAESIVISDIAVMIEPDAINAVDYHVGDLVEISARSTRDGQLIGYQMRLKEMRQGGRRLMPAVPDPSSTPSPTMALSPTATPQTVTPQDTETPDVTRTPHATVPPPAHRSNNSRKPLVTRGTPFDEIVRPLPTRSASSHFSMTETACRRSMPAGWHRYTIEAGDTLSEIALRSNVSIQTLIEVNCIENPALLTMGQEIFVPRTSVNTGSDGTTSAPQHDDHQSQQDDNGSNGGGDGGGSGNEGDGGNGDKHDPDKGNTSDKKSP